MVNHLKTQWSKKNQNIILKRKEESRKKRKKIKLDKYKCLNIGIVRFFLSFQILLLMYNGEDL